VIRKKGSSCARLPRDSLHFLSGSCQFPSGHDAPRQSVLPTWASCSRWLFPSDCWVCTCIGFLSSIFPACPERGERFSFPGSFLPVQLLFPHPLFQCISPWHFIEHIVGLACIILECIDKVASGVCPRDNDNRSVLYRKSAGCGSDSKASV
jgi:hypothetical protein